MEQTEQLEDPGQVDVDVPYKNLEKMVSYGFLFLGAHYQGVDIVLKTVNERELETLKFFNQAGRGFEDSLYKISLCTFMLNGENMLVGRGKNISSLVEFYRGLPEAFVSDIIKNIITMQETSLEAAEYLEGFCYNDRSKNLWRAFKNLGMSSDRMVGVEGIDMLGIGYVKDTWMAMNSRLEDEDEYYSRMRLALLVASAYNPKGVKEITTRVSTQRDNLENYRSELSKYGRDKNRLEAKTKNNWTAPLDTREDIVRELHKQMRGEKDKHDLFIDKYFKDMRDKVAAQKRALEEKQKESRLMLDVNLEQEGSRPATEEEINRLSRKRSMPGLARVEDPEKMTYEKKQRFLTKTSPRVIKAKE